LIHSALPPAEAGTRKSQGTDADTSASIGIAVYPFDGEDATALLASADAAMYRSKKRGPGGWAASDKQTPHPKKNSSFTARLKAAVDGEQWVLHYQPIVDLVPDRLIGVEALIRWRDGNGTLIPPGEFISLAEDIGLIESIADWVLKELCAQFRLWQDLGQDIDISYNVSPHQLWDPDFAKKVLDELAIVEVEAPDHGQVVIGTGALERVVRKIPIALPTARTAALVADPGAARVADEVADALAETGLRIARVELPGGERAKTVDVLGDALTTMHRGVSSRPMWSSPSVAAPSSTSRVWRQRPTRAASRS
jgi:hypothetical protein